MPKDHLPVPLPKPGEWYTEGVCKEYDVGVFYSSETEDLAIEICHDCPVQGDCAEYASTNKIEFGVWGGTRESDRRPRRRRVARSDTQPRKRPACPHCGKSWVVVADAGRLTCLSCNAKWPGALS